MRQSTSFPDGLLLAMRILYLILFVLLLEIPSYCAIRVPDDYPSLQEAVEHSAAVDEIIITADQAELLKDQNVGGIQMIGKQLVIRGAVSGRQAKIASKAMPVNAEHYSGSPKLPYLYSREHASFYIEDSDIRFENVAIDCSRGNFFLSVMTLITPSSFIIDSSTVRFHNCTIEALFKTNSSLYLTDTRFQCEAKIEGHHVLNALDYPILYLDSCSDERIEIIRSSIQALTYGPETIRMHNCSNLDLILYNSQIDCQTIAGNGVSVNDSTDIRILLDQSSILAGDANPADGHNFPGRISPYGDLTTPSMTGGAGMALIHSSLTLTGGEIFGGAGSN
ncbi:hypothetical protein K8I31_11655, partial [bacterium]|nr:hypothetical protein [bacterium]